MMNVENLYFDRSQLKACGKNVIIGKTVRIRHPEHVIIGDNVIIDDFCYISGQVAIGDYVHIGNTCTVSASKDSVSFGPFSTLAPGAKIFAGSSNYLSCALDLPTIPEQFTYDVIRGAVNLGRFVLVGANTVISPGVDIPEGCAFGANMVVKKSMILEPWHLIFDHSGVARKRQGVDQLLKKVSEFYTFKD